MTTTSTIDHEVVDNHHFEAAQAFVQQHFAHVLETNGHNLFVVAIDLPKKPAAPYPLDQAVVKQTLFDVYLDSFADPVERQYHNCSACRSFINRFGRLASINADGTLVSAMWRADEAPFRDAFAAMAKIVQRGKITAVFQHESTEWGEAVTGGTYGYGEKEWHHFAVTPPKDMVWKSATLTAGQKRAASLQDYLTLQRALATFDVATIKQAITLLETDALTRSEKFLGVARFLLECHELMHKSKNKNVLWLQVAKAAPGWCTPRSGMIGTLLDDIQSGMQFTLVKKRFSAKMDPLKYQRPTAAPSTGTIVQAEKLVAQLGIERSLERRFARFDEVQKIWVPPAPTVQEEKKGGVFGHLKAKEDLPVAKVMATPPVTITWDKFSRTVLPNALKIELYLEVRMAFCGVTTATHTDAPPILQWDSEEERNPFSWYFYHQGSSPQQWGLRPYTWAEVSGIMLKPNMWNGKHAHHGNGAVLILQGAADVNSDNAGLGLFPETMKADLHSVRSVIEAYSQKGALSGKAEASVNGLGIADRNGANIVRVTSAMGQATYTIDRWD